MNDDNKLAKLVEGVFQNYTPDVKERALSSISQRCGIRLENLDLSNAEAYLNAMYEELSGILPPWKAKFVTQVVGKLIDKHALRRP